MNFANIVESILSNRTIVIVSGLHGDEPAGNIAADHFKSYDNVHVISHVNKTSKRRVNRRDINRHFDDKGKSDKIQEHILSKIESISPILVIDLHEDDEVNGVYAYCSEELRDCIKKCLSNIELNLAKIAHGDKTDKGVIVNGKQPYKGTLERALKRRGILYCTIEVPSGNGKFKERVNCLKEIVSNIIAAL